MDEPAAHVVHERDRPVERWGDVVSWRTLVGATGDPTDGLVLGTAELAPGARVDGALHRHEPAADAFADVRYEFADGAGPPG